MEGNDKYNYLAKHFYNTVGLELAQNVLAWKNVPLYQTESLHICLVLTAILHANMCTQSLTN